MIMIAFITVNKKKFSTLDCGSKLLIPRGFEVSVSYSHLQFGFYGRKNMIKKKTVSLGSHPASQDTHVYFVHIYEYMYTEI